MEFARRYVNDGFSGGEMKRAEILQLAMLQPSFAILDETDSGLDADAVRLASQSIAEIGGEKDGHADHHPPRPSYWSTTHPNTCMSCWEAGSWKPVARNWPMNLHRSGYDRIRKAYPDAAASNEAMVRREEAGCCVMARDSVPTHRV